MKFYTEAQKNAVSQRVNALHAEGLGYSRIAEALKREGFKSPNKKFIRPVYVRSIVKATERDAKLNVLREPIASSPNETPNASPAPVTMGLTERPELSLIRTVLNTNGLSAEKKVQILAIVL